MTHVPKFIETYGYLKTDAQKREAKVNGSFRGAISKAGRNTNRADALLKRFD